MTLSLWPYQEQALAGVLERFARKIRRVLLVLPTGGGKTVIAAELIRRVLEMGRRVIFCAHRRELIKQTFAKLVRLGIPPELVGIVMAGVEGRCVDNIAPRPETLGDDELWRLWARRRPQAPVKVASIDTFRNHARPEAEVIIVDEAHRALAKSYVDVQRAYPAAWHLGLTATPFRADGKGLGDAYDDLIVAATFAELVEQGFLVAPSCWGSKLKANLKGVKRSKGDYNADELARAVNRSELIGDIVDHYVRRGNDAPAFCFAVNVEHSRTLAARFNDAGIAARHVDGSTETSERDDALAALRDGGVRVLCNCNVFTEGTDVPQVKTIILARPTLSEGLYLQQAGRGARPHPGSPPFVLLDHAGCVTEFGAPQEPREYTLEGRKKRDKMTVSLPPRKECPTCYALVPSAQRTCPGCDYAWPAAELGKETPREKDGELELLVAGGAVNVRALAELTHAEIKHLKEWGALVETWRAENKERDARGEPLREHGWILYQWRRKTGLDHAPKGAKIPKLTPEQKARSEERRRAKRREGIVDRRTDRDAARTHALRDEARTPDEVTSVPALPPAANDSANIKVPPCPALGPLETWEL
ncbi:DEAD/DEAH box helicase [Sorangium sp. So ce1182]|uniref:DEAD/DEAH box helicase n=1 Tax=Sorangium sp. So ce1182 TaxID=3133334 RepID=UPI003F61BE69